MSVALVLGAGASLANALYFRGQRMQSTRPPLDTTFFAAAQGLNLQFTASLRTYYRRLTRRDPSPELLRQVRMEEFFKDLYFDFQESPNDENLRRAYTDLVDLYAQVLRQTTNWLCADARTGAPIGRLISDAATVNDDVTVITFNHDLVIESEIIRRRRLASRWCLDRGYGSIGESLTPLYLTAGSHPRFPVHEEGLCSHSQPLTILKLHGSLNWMVRLNGTRPTARTLSGQSGTKDILLLTSREAEERARFRRSEGGRGRSGWNMWPVIIPPVYAKQALRQVVRLAWDDAQRSLENAHRVVFFGYSLPAIDIDAEKLFERSLARNPHVRWLDIIDPAPAAAQRYAALAPALPVRWYPSTESFRESGSF